MLRPSPSKTSIPFSADDNALNCITNLFMANKKIIINLRINVLLFKRILVIGCINLVYLVHMYNT